MICIVTRSEVKEVFHSLLDRISTDVLREKVLDVWESVGKDAMWDSVHDARFGTAAPDVKLVDHIVAVTTTALSIAEHRKNIYGVNYDVNTIVMAGLLHDVGKVVEFYPESDGSIKSTGSAATTKHWFIGAYWALYHGLPDQIVNIIVNHTNQNTLSIEGYEAKLVYLADMLDADMIRYSVGAPLLTQSLKKK